MEDMLDSSDNILISLLVSRCGRAERDAWRTLREMGVSIAQSVSDPGCVERVTSLHRALTDSAHLEDARAQIAGWRRAGIGAISIDSACYPDSLRTISDPPSIFFYLGAIEKVSGVNSFVSIVGARNGDRKGCDFAMSLASQLASRGVSIVSGLAIGIDTAAHTGALSSKSSFPTVAVLGNGLPSIYPRSNGRLAREILDRGGLILSQFEPGTPPYPSNFLDRNRTIAGLSVATVVVQAGERSGSLATARYALEAGREVLAVPGFPDDPRSKGTNRLIREGAVPVTSMEELLDVIPGISPSSLEESSEGGGAGGLDPESDSGRVVRYLQANGDTHIESFPDEIQSDSDLEGTLLELELSGIIERLPGNMLGLKAL